MMYNNQKLAWVNWVKVLCMFLVFFYHSESRSYYYVLRMDDIIEPFFVNVFFLISGYLIFRKNLKPEIYKLCMKDYWHDYGKAYLYNVVFKIVIPTIIFGALLFVPKVLMRGGEMDLFIFLRQSIGGCGLWFTPALAVAELLLFCLLIFRKINPYFVLLCSVGFIFIAEFLHKKGVSGFPWFYQTGMLATIFMAMGGVFFDLEHRKKISELKCKEVLYFAGIITYTAVCLTITPPLTINILKISLLGYVMAIFSCVIIIHYAKKLPANKIIDRIGSHTLGLYFLSGAIPETLCSITKKLLDFNSIIICGIALVSFLIGIVMNEMMVRFFPFLFDLRLLKKKTFNNV